MRNLSYLALALMPAALVAQAPAAVDYSAVLKAETTAVDALLKDFHPLEALQEAEKNLPATLPAFDKKDANVAMRSSISFSGLTRLYLLTAKAAVQAGEWEKVKDYCEKAEACAKVNYDNTKAALDPVMAVWQGAIDTANKAVKDNGERIKALRAKPGRNEAEEKEYQAFLAKDALYNTSKDTKVKNEAAKFLLANKPRFDELEAKAVSAQEQNEINAYKVHETNLVQGPKVIKTLQDNIDATKAEADLCPAKIEAATKPLLAETEEINKGIAELKIKGKVVKETSGPKFEEKKAKYFEAVLTTKSNYESRPDKAAKLNFLYRLRHNVAGTPLEAKVMEAINKVIADKDPLAVEKKAPQGKKAKK